MRIVATEIVYIFSVSAFLLRIVGIYVLQGGGRGLELLPYTRAIV